MLFLKEFDSVNAQVELRELEQINFIPGILLQRDLQLVLKLINDVLVTYFVAEDYELFQSVEDADLDVPHSLRTIVPAINKIL